MAKDKTLIPKFGVCVQSDDPDLLTPRMIYQILPDERASKDHYVRVIDNEGEDYLYPASFFIVIDLPRKVERAVLGTPLPQPAR
jgi:hypothetical protein